MQKETYNGWTNYATWRVNLEFFDGINWVRDDIWGDDVHSLASQLQGYVEQRLDEEAPHNNAPYANSYAHAFISDVNWYEIAQNINESYKLGLKA